MTKTARPLAAGGLSILLAAAIGPALAADKDKDEAKLGWSSQAEFSYVLTAGNSESTTLGFNGTSRRRWKNALLRLRCGALEVETTSDLGVAVGTESEFTVPQVTQTTAESYYAAGKYDRHISERTFWYTAAGWLRNEFSGISDRYVVSGGMGNIWYDRDDFSFRSNYGLSYTDQQDIVEIPLVKTSFAGVLVATELRKKFGKDKAEYGNDFDLNYSLADSDNWRWTMQQWLSTSLTEKLALKLNLNWLFNNVPAFREYPLLEGSPPTDMGNTVLVQLDKLDTIFSASLVVNF